MMGLSGAIQKWYAHVLADGIFTYVFVPTFFLHKKLQMMRCQKKSVTLQNIQARDSDGASYTKTRW